MAFIGYTTISGSNPLLNPVKAIKRENGRIIKVAKTHVEILAVTYSGSSTIFAFPAKKFNMKVISPIEEASI
ncbi:MAG: hypothetical protein NDF53_00065 [archaeon GB-1867-097]|nr:hypothetical protein [Candidatus Culexmicrobium thermophilum]